MDEETVELIKKYYAAMNTEIETRKILYGYFYPDNNRRHLPVMAFDSVEQAVSCWLDMDSEDSEWQQVETSSPIDKVAFVNRRTLDIVAVREITITERIVELEAIVKEQQELIAEFERAEFYRDVEGDD